jgi:hypothetical protein
VQLAAFCVVLNDPPPQGAQARSVFAEPERATEVPGAHTVFATHAVAGLASSSHFSPVQATAGLVPPAQYSPVLHGVHTWAEVAVPGAVSTVPAGHWAAPRQYD